jgi:hypothetical protein
MATWHYEPGHTWSYESEAVVCAMDVRFDRNRESGPDECDCLCDACSPNEPHLVERGCTCALLGCFCTEHQIAALL